MIIIFLLFILIIPIVSFFSISRSIKANPIQAVKITGIIMLLYGLWFLVGNIVTYLESFPSLRHFIASSSLKFFMLPFIFFILNANTKPLLLFSLLVGLIYVVSGIGIIRKKNWAKLLALYSSILLFLAVLCVIVYLAVAGFKGEFESEAMGYGLLMAMSLPYLPSILFLIFLPFLKLPKNPC